MQARRQPATWYDIVSFLSLAALLGLVSGAAFGAIALVLAAPAYGAETPTERTLVLGA
jgi:hypothetical protein